MFFKNITAYHLSDFALTAEELEQVLKAHAFQPCAPSEQTSQGWVPPLGRDGKMLVHAANGYLMICLQEENKLLPAAVIRQVLEERVIEIEEREHRKVRNREKNLLREELVLEMLPRAFSRSKTTFAYIDPKGGWLVVDSPTWRQAETLTEHLRAAIGTLDITPPTTQDSPQQVMTSWLADSSAPADIDLGEEVVFEDPTTEGCEVRAKRQDLWGDEIKAHIAAGKRVRRIALTWNERLSCMVDMDLSVKRLRFADIVQEETSGREPETAAERFDADFTLLTLELSTFLPRLMEIYGGVGKSAAAA